MNIILNRYISDIKRQASDIIYPVVIDDLRINCESSLLLWIKDLIENYGDQGFIKLKEESDYSIMRVYNYNYVEDTFKVAESVDRFGRSLD
jgi:hypothetical protein